MDVSSFFSGFLAALAFLGTLLAAFAFHLKRTRRKPPVRGYLDLIPDLTPQQRERVQEIRSTFLPRVQGIRHHLIRGRAELAELLFEEPTNRLRIDAVAQDILRSQSQLEQEVIEHILEERELLSPAQRDRFRRIIVAQFASGGLGVHDVKGENG